jgi:hypothetical protein
MIWPIWIVLIATVDATPERQKSVAGATRAHRAPRESSPSAIRA